MRFSFPYSHAFPGGRVSVDADDAEEGACEVAFADGVIVTGTWRREDDALCLDVPAYRTARGNAVAEHRWRLLRSKDGWRAQRNA